MRGEGVVTDVALAPLATARRTGSISVHVLVRVEVAAGAVGWGELSDLDCYRPSMPDPAAVEHAVRGWLIGEDATNVNALHRRMTASMLDYRYGARSYPPFSFDSQLAAAVEMACLDVTGRLAGRSVAELLGGAVRATLPVAYPLFAASDHDAVDRSLADLDAALATGRDTFRLYVGDDLAVAADHVRAVADRLAGRGQLKGLDFGGRFPWKVVARFLRALGDVDVPLVESATWHEDVEGLAELRRAVEADVCEHVSSTAQLERLVAAAAIDVANVSLQSGGILVARRLLERADAAGLTAVIGTTQELSLGTAAGAHLAAVTSATLAHPADIAGPLLYCDDPVIAPVRFEGSTLVVPTGAGLGVDVDERALATLRSSLLHPGPPAHGDGYVAR